MFILAFDWGEKPWEELILEFNPWDASLFDFLMARCIKGPGTLTITGARPLLSVSDFPAAWQQFSCADSSAGSPQ